MWAVDVLFWDIVGCCWVAIVALASAYMNIVTMERSESN